jgi:hypothetical protein
MMTSKTAALRTLAPVQTYLAVAAELRLPVTETECVVDEDLPTEQRAPSLTIGDTDDYAAVELYVLDQGLEWFSCGVGGLVNEESDAPFTADAARQMLDGLEPTE